MADPQELLANPRNWREHTEQQWHMVRQMLDQVGWVQPVIVRYGTGRLLDGHLRVRLAIQQGLPAIPVVEVEVSDAEEAVALASLDRITEMADTDGEQWASLFTHVTMDRGQRLERDAPELWSAFLTRPEDATAPTAPSYGNDTVDQRRTNEGMLDAYTTTDARQIMLIMRSDDYAALVERLDDIADAQDLESRTDVVAWLLDRDTEAQDG